MRVDLQIFCVIEAFHTNSGPRDFNNDLLKLYADITKQDLIVNNLVVRSKPPDFNEKPSACNLSHAVNNRTPSNELSTHPVPWHLQHPRK